MSDDYMRTSLVLKLICSECGRLLNMSYSKPKEIKGDGYISDYSKDEPTGAAMVQNKITVHPCGCSLRAQEDIETLRRILKVNDEHNETKEK